MFKLYVRETCWEGEGLNRPTGYVVGALAEEVVRLEVSYGIDI